MPEDFVFNDPLIYTQRTPGSFPIITRRYMVQRSNDFRVLLDEIPSKFHNIKITKVSDNSIYNVIDDGVPQSGECHVSYLYGIVTFNAEEEGEEFEITFASAGVFYMPISRIWYEGHPLMVQKTMKEVLDEVYTVAKGIGDPHIILQAPIEAYEETEQAIIAKIESVYSIVETNPQLYEGWATKIIAPQDYPEQVNQYTNRIYRYSKMYDPDKTPAEWYEWKWIDRIDLNLDEIDIRISAHDDRDHPHGLTENITLNSFGVKVVDTHGDVTFWAKDDGDTQIKGKVQANEGDIGGWIISPDSIEHIDNDGQGITISSLAGIKATKFDDPALETTFHIDLAGNAYFGGELTAATGSFSGSVTVGDGELSGFTITPTTLMNSNETILLDSGNEKIALGSDVAEITVANNYPGFIADGDGGFKFYIDANNYIRSNSGLLDIKSSEFNLSAGKMSLVGNSASSYLKLGDTSSTVSNTKGIYANNDGEINIVLDQYNYIRNANGIITIRGNKDSSIGFGASGFDAGDGVWLSGDSADNFRIGKAGDVRLQWTGSNLEIYNKDNEVIFSATDVNSMLGGWELDETSLSNVGNNSGIILSSVNGLKCLQDSEITFELKSDGSAYFGGRVEASEGYFGDVLDGVQIGGDGLIIVGDGRIIAGSCEITKNGIALSQGSISLGAKFSVDNSGNLVAVDGEFSGVINSSEGIIGGWAIDTNKIKSNNIVLDSDHEKIYIGAGDYVDNSTPFYVDGTGKLSLGNKLFWDGSALNAFGDFFINDGEIIGQIAATTSGSMVSDNYVAGSAGWRINGNGDAEFNDISVRGTVNATNGWFGDKDNISKRITINQDGLQIGESAKIVLDKTSILNDRVEVKNNIGDLEVTIGKLGSEYGIFAGTSKLTKDGIEINEGSISLGDKFVVNSEGSLFAAEGEFYGVVNSESGTIGGWNIREGNISKGGVVLNSYDAYISVEDFGGITNKRSEYTRLEHILGGNYVSYNGTKYLKLTGETRRVMSLTLSPQSVWSANLNWPSKQELEGDNWTWAKRRIIDASYWTSSEHPVNSSYGLFVSNLMENFMGGHKSNLYRTRLCYELPKDIYVVSGSGTEADPYILENFAGEVSGNDAIFWAGSSFENRNITWGGINAPNFKVTRSGQIYAKNAYISGSGQDSVGIGLGVNSSGKNSIAIGTNAMALSENTIAIGFNALKNISNIYNSIGIGYEAKVAGNDSLAIGIYADVNDKRSIAIGSFCYTGGDKSISIGNEAQVLKSYSVAIGNEAEANENDCISIGNFSKANNDSAIALGGYANADNINSVAIGYQAEAEAENDFVLGNSDNNVKIPGTLQVATPGAGVIVTSPDGNTTKRIGIDNSGNVIATAV